MFCARCGTALTAPARFCPVCGHPTVPGNALGDPPMDPHAGSPPVDPLAGPVLGRTGDVCPSCGSRTDAGPACLMCGQVLGLPTGVRLSGPGKRLLAQLLEGVLFLVTLGIGWAVWTLIVWARGTTPAKQLMRMTVIWTAERRAARWGRMFLREFVGRGLVVPVISALTFGVGWIVATCMIFGDTRQTLWDRLASTLVVDGYADVRPEELPASQGFDGAPYARKDRNLVFAGVGALVVLIVAGIVIGPGLFASKHTNNANTVQVPVTETPNSSAGSSYGRPPPNSDSSTSADDGPRALERAVRDYYALLPGNLEAGFAGLTDRFKRGPQANLCQLCRFLANDQVGERVRGDRDGE
jgi:hypothetical protein